MNKLLYIIALFAALNITGCSDFLEVELPDELSTPTFWRNKSDAEAALASTYSMLECATDIWEFAEIKWPVEAYREDIINLGNDALNYQNWVELYNFSYSNGNSQFTMYWEQNYKGISFANQVLGKINEIPAGAISEADRKQIAAEARFLRAYYHLKLILNWEKIIIRDKYITNQEDLSAPLSDRAAAWSFITSELETAAKNLKPIAEVSQDNLGRATQGAAYAYLGFAYLTRSYEETAQKSAHLTEAIKALQLVKGYDLVKDYISMFDGTNKNSIESIFELQFSEVTANGAQYRTALHRWMGVDELKGWDEIRPSEMLVKEFKKEGQIATTGRYDSRLYHTMFVKDDYFNDPANPRVYGLTYNERFNNQDKPAFRKYLPREYSELTKSRTGLNVPLMRFSNVLLMEAEAHNQAGHPELAIPLINLVRARADMPVMQGTSAAAVQAQIEHERILEFPLENFRFYDLRRWGTTKAALDAVNRNSFNAASHSFYPVPQTEIQSNDKL